MSRTRFREGLTQLKTRFGWKFPNEAPGAFFRYFYRKQQEKAKQPYKRNPNKRRRKGYAGHGRISRTS